MNSERGGDKTRIRINVDDEHIPTLKKIAKDLGQSVSETLSEVVEWYIQDIYSLVLSSHRMSGEEKLDSILFGYYFNAAKHITTKRKRKGPVSIVREKIMNG